VRRDNYICLLASHIFALASWRIIDLANLRGDRFVLHFLHPQLVHIGKKLIPIFQTKDLGIVMKILKSIVYFLKKIRVELFILIGCVAIFIPVIYFNQPNCVGDGSEYYAMAVSWRSTHKPFMSEMSWLQYDRFVKTSGIDGIIVKSYLQSIFPELSIGTTNDFPHFWFYSLLSVIILKAAELVSINISIHVAFLCLHCLLMTCLFIVAWRNYRWKGLLAVGLLTFLSPIVWYFDKVHTEFFTFCLSTCAVIFYLKRRYIPSAIFLALTSTQNISFAGICAFVIGVDLFYRRKDLKYSLLEGVGILLTIGLVVLQPMYYFSRYGAFTSQFMTGAADVGVRVQYFYVWFLDPDIGLFPNWLFGVGLIILSLIAFKRLEIEQHRIFSILTFSAVYVGISLAAQVSTVNMNSGGTLGIARYALWYLALFFPLVLSIIKAIRWNKIFTFATAAWLVIGILISYQSYLPTVSKFNYFSPSPVSLWIQTNIPGLYNPPPEIFAERYGGLGESDTLWRSLAVVGPDCRKVLLINLAPDNGDLVLGRASCGLNYGTVAKIIRQNLQNGTWKGASPYSYVHLSDSEVSESKLVIRPGEWYNTSIDSDLGKSIFNGSIGWSLPESWGVWTVGNHATISLPCPAKEGQIEAPNSMEIVVKPFSAPSHPGVTGKILVDSLEVWSGTIDGTQTIKVDLAPSVCASSQNITVDFEIENPASPLSLGLSVDGRLLGLGLQKIRFTSSD